MRPAHRTDQAGYMTSERRIPGLPFDLTDDVNRLIDKMGTLDPFGAPSVQPAILSPCWTVTEFSRPPSCRITLPAAIIILGAVLSQREGIELGGQYLAS